MARIPEQSGSTLAARVTGVDARTSEIERHTDGWINVRSFGAIGDGVADDTDAIQEAIDEAISRGGSLYLGQGRFRVSSLLVHGAGVGSTDTRGLVIDGDGGVLLGEESGSYDAILTIRDSVFVRARALTLDARLNGGYRSAIWVYSDDGWSMAYSDFWGVRAHNVRCGWRFGDDAYPDAHVSEISIHGGMVHNVLVGAEVIGTQTIITFNGSQLTASTSDLPSGWLTDTKAALLVRGGLAVVHGGELRIEADGGSIFDVRPIASDAFDNPWGAVSANGVAIETAEGQIVNASNPGLVGSPGVGAAQGGAIALVGCHGWRGIGHDLSAFQTSSDFVGSLAIKTSHLYGNGGPSGVVIEAGGTSTLIYVEPTSFGVGGFSPPPGSVSGGTVSLAVASNASGVVVLPGTGAIQVQAGGNIQCDDYYSYGVGPARIHGQSTSGASAVGVVLENTQSLDTPGSKVVSVRLNGAEVASINPLGGISLGAPTAAWSGNAIYSGPGVPSNANGANGDVFFRTDTPGTANQRIYVKAADAWVGIL